MTLEANPTSVEATRFRGYRAAGVNRVSLGVQALDDAALKELGRLHSAREALDAVAVARAHFDRYSFDLIYARPHQTPAGWAAELKSAIAEAGEHLSLYQLTIEQGTPFFALHKAGKMTMPDDDTARAFYDVTQEVCAAQACRPTRSPTMRGPAPSAGTTSSIGAATNMPASAPAPMAGSISTASAARTATEKRPESWLMRVEAAGHGVVTDELLSHEERADEFLLMGLRLAEGIDPARYAELSGRAARSATRRDPAGTGRRRDHRKRHAARDAGGLSAA